MKPDGLIVSAGFSSRMNQFKPLRNYEGIPFLFSIILKLSGVCSNIFIVTGFRAEDVREEVGRWLGRIPDDKWFTEFRISRETWNNLPHQLEFVFNPDYARGMFNSLQKGVNAMSRSEWILYHFVDQPHIPVQFYSQFAEQIAPAADWIQPKYEEKKGHPILMSGSILAAIREADSSASLKMVSGREDLKKKFWNCPYPEILQDFDTESDLRF
ncbi:MAG: NTP transferase domain-containing protein [Calditrichia bacterium]